MFTQEIQNESIQMFSYFNIACKWRLKLSTKKYSRINKGEHQNIQQLLAAGEYKHRCHPVLSPQPLGLNPHISDSEMIQTEETYNKKLQYGVLFNVLINELSHLLKYSVLLHSLPTHPSWSDFCAHQTYSVHTGLHFLPMVSSPISFLYFCKIYTCW